MSSDHRLSRALAEIDAAAAEFERRLDAEMENAKAPATQHRRNLLDTLALLRRAKARAMSTRGERSAA